MTLPRVVLAPGASGTSETMRPFVDGLVKRGLQAVAIDIPKSKAERAVPAYLALVEPGRDVIGGQSYGGRVASLLAAEHPFPGLVFFCFPLHPPGKVEAWRERTAHLNSIGRPMLFLSGESDPFARIDLLCEVVGAIDGAVLHTYPGLGHTMRPVLDDALDRAADFVRGLSV